MKNTKIYIGILLPILVFLCNFTFAANEVSVSGFTQLFELGGNMLYIILWPLLVITGLALGNDLALGSVFGLDEVLYKFWLVMRNFASLALVGIILYDIVSAMWNGKVAELLKKVGKYILAGILIPASWRFVPFMLSVSNLLITGVGELPLNFRDNFASTATQKILTTHVYLNLADKVQTSDFFRFAAYYGNGDQYYMTCKFDRPTITPPATTETTPTSTETKPASLKTYDAIYISVIKAQADANKDLKISDKYCALDQHTLVDLSVLSKPECQKLNNVGEDDGWGGNINTEPCLKVYAQDDKLNFKMTDEYANAVTKGTATIKVGNASMDDAGKNGSMVGPLYTIYASLMNFSTISASNDATMTDTKLIEHMVKLLVTAMAILPLVGLAIIAMVRVGVIWLLMAFSPFIALFNSLYSGKDDSDKMKGANSFWGDGEGRIAKMSRSIGEIVKLILQPVIIIFGISLGLIFLTTIQFKLADDTSGGLGFMGMDCGKPNMGMQSCNTQNISINVKTSPTTSGDSMFFDLFHMLIMNIFGIVVMRQIWMMSMKFSAGKDGIMTKLTDDVTKYANDYVKSRPIIPFPTKDGLKGISWKGLSTGAKDASTNIMEKVFPKDKTYESSGFKGIVDDGTARMSKERGEANKEMTYKVDNIKGTVAKNSPQAAEEFAKLLSDSKIGTDDKIKAANINKSSGVNYALKEFGLGNTMIDAAKNEYFAGSMFDNYGSDVGSQFGTHGSAKEVGKKIIETLTTKRKSTSKNNSNIIYIYQNNKDKKNISLLPYDIVAKDFVKDSDEYSLPLIDAFGKDGSNNWTKLQKDDLDDISKTYSNIGNITTPYNLESKINENNGVLSILINNKKTEFKRNTTTKKYDEMTPVPTNP